MKHAGCRLDTEKLDRDFAKFKRDLEKLKRDVKAFESIKSQMTEEEQLERAAALEHLTQTLGQRQEQLLKFQEQLKGRVTTLDAEVTAILRRS